jgi:uncharacterized membrane protein YphA (DoxX/SURF4 family)
MKSIITNKYIGLVLRIALGIFFIYSSQTKIMHPEAFAQAIRAYQILPDAISNIPAIFLPWLEFYLGLFLIVGYFTRTNAVAAISLLGIFMLLMLSAILRGLEIDCGCGVSLMGVTDASWLKITENLILSVLLFILLITNEIVYSIDALNQK